MTEKQLTFELCGHTLTNFGVWSPDGRWVVYDVRSDREGAVFDGTRIERVNVESGATEVLFESAHGSKCGVVTCSPVEDKVVFILGPENPTPDWQYAANHRRGVTVNAATPGKGVNLDARDLSPPFMPGALRGGSHVHVFSGDGEWVSFTYQDHLLARFEKETPEHDVDLRNVGVSVPLGPVRVSKDHPRNHDGAYFSVLVTRTTANPKPGSDEISKAFEDAWVGVSGYRRADGRWQRRALAFQGHVLTRDGRTIAEAFIVDIPDNMTLAGDGPLEGTETHRPTPPRGTVQRRLTYTADRDHPGLQGPRHWLRSSPDGSRIALLMKDDGGVVQLWTISPNGGPPVQVTRNPWDVASAFSWSADGQWIAHVMDNSVFVTKVATGRSRRLTPRSSDAEAPRPEACVFSPDGSKIAFVRTVPAGSGRSFNQVFVVFSDSE
jgi:WD40 repeat protein